MSVLNNSLLLGADAAGGYTISRSLRFNSADSAYLSRTPASAGNRKTWTWAGWVKRSALGSIQFFLGGGTTGNDTDQFVVYFAGGDTLRITTGVTILRETTQVFRDLSSWYHFTIAVDTTQGTANNRVKFYVNGLEVTAFSTTNNPTQNADTGINTAAFHAIGRNSLTPEYYFSGLLADIHFIDGQALDPTSFGEFSATTGVWMPKAYTGSYGTNGFKLNFSDNSTAAALGTDTSGQGNTWTVNNLSVTAGAGNDSLVDVPTNGSEVDTGSGGQVRGNYAVWNPLAKGSDCTLSNGNLDVAWGTAGSTTQGSATFGMSSGKWYWETTITASSASPTNAVLGITTKPFGDSEYPGYTATSWGYRGSDGQKWNNTSGASYGASYANGDVVGVAFDADNGTLTFYKNGSSQGTAFTGLTSGPYFPAIGDQSSSQTFSAATNFGQRPFAYTAPSGFKALCTANLPAPVVTKPSTVFDVATWTGDGASSRTITLPSSPSVDLVWLKSRSNAFYHGIYDAVRGANKVIFPNDTLAEINTPANGYVSAFNSNGFTLTAGSSSSDDTNKLNSTYVAWCWDAGSSTVTNTQGSITSSVRANATAGFSVVTYTGTGTTGTVGHGLGVVPSMMIVKRRDAVANWYVYHSAIGNTGALGLNLTNATITSANFWNNTSPTSTVLTVSAGSAEMNTNGGTYVVYAFAPVSGYSSFGSYTGNGSSDGPFVHTGFRPRWILIKVTNISGESWVMKDSVRGPYNPQDANLYADLSAAEQTANSTRYLDLLSNGFKWRGTEVSVNGNGNTYIYAAFAESPFQYARAR